MGDAVAPNLARHFYIADVSAERRCAGNQLAVIVGNDDLPDETMQRLDDQPAGRVSLV